MNDLRVKNHFQKFSLAENFDINIEDLEEKYLNFQKQFHPDVLVSKKEEEKNIAINNSIVINEAYEILSDEVSRAIYLLNLEGININDDNCPVRPSQETLMMILELKEELSEVKTVEEFSNIKKTCTNSIKDLILAAREDFQKKDYQAAAQKLIKVKYFDKTLADLKKMKNKH